MYCIQCGKELPDDARFCYSCGKPTANAEGVSLNSSSYGSENRDQNNCEKGSNNTVLMKMGYNLAWMEAYENRVVITKVNQILFGQKTKTTVFYRDITSVGYKSYGFLSLGYLVIMCSGNSYRIGTPDEREKNPYCVPILDKEQDIEALKIKEFIEGRM